MAWIKIIDEQHAEGKLKEVYEEITSARGKLSNIMKIHSLNPQAMKEHMDLYLSVMFSQSGLRREDCELIAVVVSSANECGYCINHHAEALNHYWKDKEKIKKVVEDYKQLDLSVKQMAMLSYAVKLTTMPNAVNENDIENLKLHDFTDENILNINLIVSYFNFVNRIVLGLGVDYSEEELKGYKY
ncbi:MAG: peroxidase-related enzyme [Bacteroidetes bacterium]|nr:peroxidase-related enzyme [Bacteroidota bacterium]